MGIFLNNKKPYPICGKAIPKLLATKIAGEIPICSDCSKNISMESQRVEALSVEELKEHLAMRLENAKYIENIFRPNKHLDDLQIVTAALFDMMGYSAGDDSSTDSTADELIKFKELLDGGIITQEEFDEKKNQLLET